MAGAASRADSAEREGGIASSPPAELGPAAAEASPAHPRSPETPLARPEPHELASLIARADAAARRSYRSAREPAVYAYCLRVCSVDSVDAAVAAAFVAMFEEVCWGEREPVDVADLDDFLLRSTRAEAAERAERPPPTARLRRAAESLLGRPSARAVCEVMPKLLAARAGDLLSSQEAELMHRHLAGCRTCGAAEGRAVRAERAFHERIAAPPAEPARG